MIHFLQHHLLSVFIVLTFGIIGFLSWEKYHITENLEDYTLEDVLEMTTHKKNTPLILELFKLGDQVKKNRDLSYHNIKDETERDALILLTRICKDTCKAIRCRIDPGLGHACRINCPQSKIKPCRLSVKIMNKQEKQK